MVPSRDVSNKIGRTRLFSLSSRQILSPSFWIWIIVYIMVIRISICILFLPLFIFNTVNVLLFIFLNFFQASFNSSCLSYLTNSPENSNTCAHWFVTYPNILLEIEHLEVMVNSTSAEGILRKLITVFQHGFKMLLSILEVLESHSVISLSEVSIALVFFIPQGLHLMYVELLGVFVTTEQSHDVLGLFNIVDFELIFGI